MIALAVILAVIVVIRFSVISAPEDMKNIWVCQNGEWVKQGEPSDPAPTTDCEGNNENIDANNVASGCQLNSGNWLAEHQECETGNSLWCEQTGGEFSECESACRHNPETDICTMQCVAVCKFSKTEITDFASCAASGNPIMESYPRKCRANGQNFTENIGNELEKADLIRIETPRPNQKISSPLTITGQARGTWFFEASFPVVLTDWDGKIIAEGVATAQSDWMTENFVPFKATLEFNRPSYGDNGSLILKKDNPSGLPENDDALEIPILF